MHAMLLDSQPARLDELQIAFLEAGIHVTGSGSLAVAECCLRRAAVDVLLVDEAAGGLHVADIVAMAERRNPNVVTLILSQAVNAATDRWSPRFGSLHCVLDTESDPALVARMAKASLKSRACDVAPVAQSTSKVAARGGQPTPNVAQPATQSTISSLQEALQKAPPAAVASAESRPARRVRREEQDAPAMGDGHTTHAQPEESVIQAKARRHAEQVRTHAELSALRRSEQTQTNVRTNPRPQGHAQPDPVSAPVQTGSAAPRGADPYPALRVHPALAAQRAAEAERLAEADRLAEAERRARARLQAAVQANPVNQQAALQSGQSGPVARGSVEAPRPVTNDVMSQPQTVATRGGEPAMSQPPDTPVFHSSRRRIGLTDGRLMSA